MQSVQSDSIDEPVRTTTRARHEKYYFSYLVFLVEDCLFNLPRHYFEQSEAFQGMFSMPPSDRREGTSDDNPIVLDGTKLEDFEAFVKALVPMVEGGEKDVLSLQEWLAVLELAYKWDFENTRRIAIEAIAKFQMNEVDEINLTQKYGIVEWALSAYQKLMVRERPLSANEMKLLGFEFSSKMAEAREEYGKLSRSNDNQLTIHCEWYCNHCDRYNPPFQKCSICSALDPTSIARQSAIRGVIHAVFGDPVEIS
ncbi:hypothetical protein BD410DRAFT_733814 [Rickenella mellea]|uniref:Uncharacterized protein n=1 Tax=Rickenella mellea TaxID=50990 RepID=A0A4Y7PGR5_9AGAM|nr:hypothetical protein BD410DRAFT_733814 [Rickenella mellea]